jgi:hypothetical protein
MDNIEQLVADREHALLSLDADTIHAYQRRWGVRIEPDPEAFWVGVHKDRTALLISFPEARALSKAWLEQRGHTVAEPVLGLETAGW